MKKLEVIAAIIIVITTILILNTCSQQAAPTGIERSSSEQINQTEDSSLNAH